MKRSGASCQYHRTEKGRPLTPPSPHPMGRGGRAAGSRGARGLSPQPSLHLMERGRRGIVRRLDIPTRCARSGLSVLHGSGRLKLLQFYDVQQGTVGDALVNAALWPLLGHPDLDRPGSNQRLVRVLDLVAGAVAEQDLKRDEGVGIQMLSNLVGAHRARIPRRSSLSTG